MRCGSLPHQVEIRRQQTPQPCRERISIPSGRDPHPSGGRHPPARPARPRRRRHSQLPATPPAPVRPDPSAQPSRCTRPAARVPLHPSRCTRLAHPSRCTRRAAHVPLQPAEDSPRTSAAWCRSPPPSAAIVTGASDHGDPLHIPVASHEDRPAVVHPNQGDELGRATGWRGSRRRRRPGRRPG